MNWLWYLLIFTIAVVITAIIVPLAIKLAWRYNAIDYPDGRRINTEPTPRLGGIALFAGITVSLAIFLIFGAPNI
jgi:UDP-GlcNAc:undecaprenyl-phosphate GlcNAc-1-phosphate transferase